jgi:hypothetical protein
MVSLKSFVPNRPVYHLTHNGIEGFTLPPSLQEDVIMVTDGTRDFGIDDTYTVTVGGGGNAISFHSKEYESTFTLREARLEDAMVIFPNTPRTFLTIEDLEDKVATTLRNAMSYEPRTLPASGEDTIFSFTFDGDDVLELIRVDGEGEMTLREDGDWKPVEGESPTVFDRDMIDIEPDDVDKAVAVFDEKNRGEDGVRKGDLLPFAKLVQ